MLRSILVILMVVQSTLISAQTMLSVGGRVVDADSGQPLEGVSVVVGKSGTVTDSYGSFKLSFPSSEYVLVVTHIGYQKQSIELNRIDLRDELIVRLESEFTSLDEVEIFGQTPQQRAQELSTVTVGVSKDFLITNRENSLMQTLRKIPGVSTITIGSGQSKPVIRGLGFNRVSVVQNGIKHEAQQWGNDHGLEIDQYAVEDVQIIKGPASLLYGSDAIGGVIDIRPPQTPAKNTFSGDINLTGETNNELIGVSSSIVARNENWFYRARVTYRDYADYKVPTDRVLYDNYVFELADNRIRNTAGNETNFGLTFGFVGERFKSETSLSNMNGNNGFFANAHGLEVRSSSIDYDASFRDVDLPFHEVNHFKWIQNFQFFRPNSTLQIDFGFQNNERTEQSEPVPHGYMPKPSSSSERVFSKNTFTINIHNSLENRGAHELSFGFNGEIQNNRIGGWGFLIPSFKRFTAGVFAFDHIRLSEYLHLQGGLRYDVGRVRTDAYVDWFQTPVENLIGIYEFQNLQRASDEDLSFGSYSGSIGMSYLKERTALKFNLGKSFRIPLANELASDGVNYHMYRFERGQLDLKAEESYQFDFEWNQTGDMLQFGFSPFVNYFTNFIYLNPTADYYETLQVYAYQQAAVLRYGGEFSFGLMINQSLSLDSSVEYVYAEQLDGPKKGFTLPFNPPLSSLFSLSKSFKTGELFRNTRLIADYRITAAQNRIVPPEEKTPGYQLFNLSLLSELYLNNSTEPLNLRFKINNLFNTKYFDHTSFYRLIDVPEPARNFSLSITYNF